MEDKAARKVDIHGKVELVYEPELQGDQGVKETELQKEQDRKYRQLETMLDQLERTVGVWNPANCYLTVQQALDSRCEKADVLDQRQSVDFIGVKAKELNKDLEQVVNRFRQLKEIDYD